MIKDNQIERPFLSLSELKVWFLGCSAYNFDTISINSKDNLSKIGVNGHIGSLLDEMVVNALVISQK